MGLPAVAARTNFAAVSPNTSCRRRDTCLVRVQWQVDVKRRRCAHERARDWLREMVSERRTGTGIGSGAAR